MDEDAEAGDAGDDAVDNVADVLSEELQDFDAAEFAFGIAAAAFGEGEMFAEVDESGVVGGHAEGFGHHAGTATAAGHIFDFWFSIIDGGGGTVEFGGSTLRRFAAALLFAVVAICEDGFEGAVNHEVRIAADGAGEVGVVVAGEGEVADGLGRILGGAHGLQHREVDGVGDGRATNGIEDTLQGAAIHDLGKLASGDHEELLHLLGAHDVRVRMDAAQDCQAGLGQPAGDGFVGLDHEHFNDFVREGVIFRLGVDDVAFFINDELHFRQIEHDHALGEAALADGAGEAVHADEQLTDFRADDWDFGIGRGFE